MKTLSAAAVVSLVFPLGLALAPVSADAGLIDSVKEAGRSIGHAARDVTREIGHTTRDVTREIGHATRDALTGDGEKSAKKGKDGKEEASESTVESEKK